MFFSYIYFDSLINNKNAFINKSFDCFTNILPLILYTLISFKTLNINAHKYHAITTFL